MRCADWGITHIDTANVYGMGGSEEVIGRYLSANPGARDDFVIATKAAITRDGDGNRIFRNDRAHLEAELDKSLARMGVERVDLFYVHRRDPEVPIEEVTENLVGIMGTGKIGAFGFSEIAPSSLRRAAAVHPVAAVQSEYSLQTRSPEMGLVQTCAELGTALVAFSPVGRSLLTDHPLSSEAVQELGFLKVNPRFQPPNFTANVAATDRFSCPGRGYGGTGGGIGDCLVAGARGSCCAHSRNKVGRAFQGMHSRRRNCALAGGFGADRGRCLPIGWAHGDRYSQGQWVGPERYC